MRKFICVSLLALLAACATPQTQFVASRKSPLELRAAQTRLVAGNADDTMRGVVATLQDLGYRITRVESDARTVSATRQATLRMAVVVQPHSPQDSLVRANATIVALRRETQVDLPAFYQQDFFAPLSAMLERTVANVPDDVSAPDAVRPVAELNTSEERKAAARKAAARKGPASAATIPTGSKTQ